MRLRTGAGGGEAAVRGEAAGHPGQASAEGFAPSGDPGAVENCCPPPQTCQECRFRHFRTKSATPPPLVEYPHFHITSETPEEFLFHSRGGVGPSATGGGGRAIVKQRPDPGRGPSGVPAVPDQPRRGRRRLCQLCVGGRRAALPAGADDVCDVARDETAAPGSGFFF